MVWMTRSASAMRRQNGINAAPNRENGIPSCAQCRGEGATGAGTVPRLASELAPYLTRQMQMIRSKFRDSGAMHGIVKDLTEQLRSLAVYLQSL
jgi:cytochrome c553